MLTQINYIFIYHNCLTSLFVRASSVAIFIFTINQTKIGAVKFFLTEHQNFV